MAYSIVYHGESFGLISGSIYMPAATQNSTRWIVLKFGGTSVSRRNRWDNIGHLLQQRAADEKARVLIVVSALSGVTNILQVMADSGANHELLKQYAEQLIDKHQQFCTELELDAEQTLGIRFKTLRDLADDPQAKTGSLAWQAELLAQGELLSSTLGAGYLRSKNIDIGWLDSRDWLNAAVMPNQSPWAARLSVNCDTASQAQQARDKAAGLPHTHAIAQGFIARANDGGTAILGRGGSDTSAAYFGALLAAKAVEIWTDVPGMFSANPRQVADARLLSRLDYEEAQEIATTGAKVLHPRCIQPCRDAGVPLSVRDTENPHLPGTLIADGAATLPGVKAISSRKGIVLVSMESIGMWQQVGFLADVFECFRKHGLSIDLVSTSETNVTVSLDPSENLVNSNVLDALCNDLAQICRVKVIAPCAAITLVGRGMRSRLHRLTDVLAEFGRERVHLISQSSNDLNLTFVVDEALVDDALMPHLHGLLISSGAMPVDETAVFGISWRKLNAANKPRSAWWLRSREALLKSAKQGTPRYVYDLSVVRQQAKALAEITAIDRRFYAIKANSHPAILKTLVEQGYGLECVSQGELEHVFATLPALDSARVLFTPSFAPRSEYAFALEHGVNVTVDNAVALIDWADMFAGKRLIARVDPGFGHGHHEKVRTGGKTSKFGRPIDEMPQLIAAVNACGAKLVGLHAHIGSGIFEPAHWRSVYAQLASVAEQIGTIESIDVGGGIGIPYEPDGDPFDLNAYAQTLAEMKALFPQYQLWVEPGRFLVAEAGVLLARVSQTASKADIRRIGVDAGMHTLMRPALYNAFHEIVNLSRFDDPPGTPAEIVGPICESTDVLGRRRQLPQTTIEGDVLLIANAGAYGAVMANQYNLRGLPIEEIIND